MKLVYVAGPFSAEDRPGVERNIALAEQVGMRVAALGAFPVIPHANTSAPEFETIQPYRFWIKGTMTLLRRCDAVIMVPGWQKSLGATGERADAVARGCPVFESPDELRDWLKERDQ